MGANANPQPVPDRTTTTTAPTPANQQQVPQTQQEAAQQNPELPQVNYYLYSGADNTPTGILREVNDTTGMRCDKVDTNGNWQPSNDALQDIYPLADMDNETSLWAYTNPATEQQAKQVYNLHFAAESQKPPKPPTSSVQSPPASGSTAPPTVVGTPSKFYSGIAVKSATGEVHVGSYVRRGHIVSGYVAHRRVVNLPGLGDVVDDVSGPGEPISDHSLEVIKKHGLDRLYTEVPRSDKTKALLGRASDTRSLYMQNGEYTPARAAWHEEVMDKLFNGEPLYEGQDDVPEVKPKGGRPKGELTAMFTAGGSASGKSSAINEDKSIVPDAAVTISADDFKMAAPEWTKLTSGDSPAMDASSVLHDESNDIAAKAIERAIREGYNLVLDGTGNNDPGLFMAKIKKIHGQGYKTNILMVDAPTNVAINRMVKRGEQSHRFVAVPDMFLNHHSAIERMLEWSTSPLVHRFSIWRTANRPPTLIAEGGHGRRNILNQDEWDALLEKRHELEGEANG